MWGIPRLHVRIRGNHVTRYSIMGCSRFSWVFSWVLDETGGLHVSSNIRLTSWCFSGLCRRRGWIDPAYECYRDPSGYTCLVLVNGREYQTDLSYESHVLARENAAMRAFMVCRNFSVNGGMLARNGIVQGLPATAGDGKSRRKGRNTTNREPTDRHSRRRSGAHSSSSSTASFD